MAIARAERYSRKSGRGVRAAGGFMEQLHQEKTLDMQRGLFLIRYDSSDSPEIPPRVTFAPEAGSEGAIDLIVPPDCEEAVLWSPGASLIARASRHGRLRILVLAGEPNGSLAARIQIVPLSDDPGGLKLREAAAQLDLSSLQLLGHVAGRGDVVVDHTQWIGGPLAPSRIEGLAIRWPDLPRDLTLRYAVTVGGARPQLGQFVEVGTFAGTRGHALPLVGATIELDGRLASAYQLVVESIFLGSPQTRISGRRVVLCGPTGREPLVGLRLRIEPAIQVRSIPQPEQATELRASDPVAGNLNGRNGSAKLHVASGTPVEADNSDAAALKAAAPVKRAGRVRVFRSTSRTGQLHPGG